MTMVHPLDLPPTDLPQWFARLELDSQHGVASEQTEADPQNSSPRMIATDVRQQVGFLTLPREIRDQIHLNLIVVEDPIQYDTHFKSLSRSDTFTDRAIMWMFEVASNTQIAREARETFYQHNTFLIYTHDIPALLSAKVHTVSFGATDGVEPTTHSTPFEAGAWVRKLAVRVGWHASGGWFPDECCRNPAHDLRTLLKSDGLQSVIVDAKFGAWSYGYPQGIGWDLLEEMNEKWGKEFKIYNDQTLRSDTHRYTSDRRDLSDRWLLEHQRSQVAEEASAEGGDDEQVDVVEGEEVELWGEAETETEDEDEDEDEDEEEEEEEEEDEGRRGKILQEKRRKKIEKQMGTRRKQGWRN